MTNDKLSPLPILLSVTRSERGIWMYVSLSNMSLLGTMLSYLGISIALRFLMSMESIARTEKNKKTI